ncbi:hypothetical protein [Psychrobacter glacincola]|uniref:Capsule polysaccharide biosynthesis protein n=1 Tax=Psychrobacter glacincola TaxID=56810 RepID=A0ABW1WAX8_9GAMM|nr:hypothetical protein [Psychrobacter glacincola]
MNAIYLCVIAEPWIKVSQELIKSLNIIPSYIVCWSYDLSSFKNSISNDAHIQNMDDAWQGLGFPKDIYRYIFDEEELKAISYYELIALKMMDRIDPDGESFPFITRLQFFRDLMGYWYNVVEDRKIDLVISPSIPHRVFDYALYVICKIRNIRFVMFQSTPFGSNSILIENIDAMPSLLDVTVEKQLPSKVVQEKIDKVCGDYSKAIPSYMLKHKANDKKNHTLLPLPHIKKLLHAHLPHVNKPYTYWVKSGFSPKDTQYSWHDFYAMENKRNENVNRFKKVYNTISISRLPKKFILVALHYQPEETSCPTGGVYSDQILMIQLLNQHLPKDVNIIVKEHKSQFYTQLESASGRNLQFYKRISEISSRVKFVSEDYDPFKLIDQAQAVVTISGTIGWESAVRGTPAIVFGRAWYEEMPRVFKVKTKSDLIAALQQLPQQKNKDMRSEIMRFHAVLEDSFVLAKHYKAFLDNNDVTMEKSVINIVYKLENFLNR